MSTSSRSPSTGDPDGDEPPASDGAAAPHGFFRLAVRHKYWLASFFVLALAILFAALLGTSASTAKSSLEQARSSAQKAKDALLQGDTAGAASWAASARTQAQAARDATHTVSWNIAAAMPWLGSPFESGQQITDVVRGLAADVLEPSAHVGAVIAPDRLLKDGHLDVQLLRSEEPTLSTISASATQLDKDAQAISDPHFVSSLADARAQLQSQTSDIATLLQNTALAARLAPTMLGADGPRTYFTGFQTNAEARGTGGLLGGFGILRFDNGVPSVDALAPNTGLDKSFTPIDLGPEYAKQFGFGNPTTDFRNSNFSSHFPYAAEIWRSMWAQQTGMNVDGVIAIDPVALSYILRATGPVAMPDGEVITADNVVELTESTAYLRFPTDQPARKQYLQEIVAAAVTKMTGPMPSPRGLLDALGKAVGEGRIAVWSASPDDQKVLEETALAHEIPDDAAPYAEVVINNLGGNKLDYYLRRGIQYTAGDCTAATRDSTITIKLTSAVPAEPLPEYVAGILGVNPDAPINAPSGTMITSVRVIATKDATLRSALSNGQRVPIFPGTERGHPTFEIQVAIPPGQSGELVINLTEPTSPGAPRVPVQPLVDEVSPVVDVPRCTG